MIRFMRPLRFGLPLCVALAAAAASAAERPARRAKQEDKRPNPCASYGPGFIMLPGTATCVRVGGAVVGDFSTGTAAPNLGVK